MTKYTYAHTSPDVCPWVRAQQARLEEAEARARTATERALAAEGRLGNAARQIRRLDMQAAVAEAEVAACRTAGDARDAALSELCARLEQRAAPAPACDPNPDTDPDPRAVHERMGGSAGCGSRAMLEQAGGEEGVWPASAHPADRSAQAQSAGGGAGSALEASQGAYPAKGQGQGQGADADAVDRLVGAWRGACAERDHRLSERAAQLAQACSEKTE